VIKMEVSLKISDDYRILGIMRERDGKAKEKMRHEIFLFLVVKRFNHQVIL
jgi:hypothetical protein